MGEEAASRFPHNDMTPVLIDNKPIFKYINDMNVLDENVTGTPPQQEAAETVEEVETIAKEVQAAWPTGEVVPELTFSSSVSEGEEEVVEAESDAEVTESTGEEES